MTPSIRPLEPGDRRAWDPLWKGYLTFYEEDLPDAVTDLTWARFFDAGEPMGAIGAFADGNLIGFCHHLFHRSTWGVGPYCYLEDLFVSRPREGAERVGRSSRRRRSWRAAGAEKLYWHTRVGNATARALYDQVGAHVGDIVYERDLA